MWGHFILSIYLFQKVSSEPLTVIMDLNFKKDQLTSYLLYWAGRYSIMEQMIFREEELYYFHASEKWASF